MNDTVHIVTYLCACLMGSKIAVLPTNAAGDCNFIMRDRLNVYVRLSLLTILTKGSQW